MRGMKVCQGGEGYMRTCESHVSELHTPAYESDDE